MKRAGALLALGAGLAALMAVPEATRLGALCAAAVNTQEGALFQLWESALAAVPLLALAAGALAWFRPRPAAVLLFMSGVLGLYLLVSLHENPEVLRGFTRAMPALAHGYVQYGISSIIFYLAAILLYFWSPDKTTDRGEDVHAL